MHYMLFIGWEVEHDVRGQPPVISMEDYHIILGKTEAKCLINTLNYIFEYFEQDKKEPEVNSVDFITENWVDDAETDVCSLKKQIREKLRVVNKEEGISAFIRMHEVSSSLKIKHLGGV